MAEFLSEGWCCTINYFLHELCVQAASSESFGRGSYWHLMLLLYSNVSPHNFCIFSGVYVVSVAWGLPTLPAGPFPCWAGMHWFCMLVVTCIYNFSIPLSNASVFFLCTLHCNVIKKCKYHKHLTSL